MPKTYPLLSVAYGTMLSEIGNKTGTYRLRLWDEARDGFVPLSRLLDVDTEGVLYIGTAEKKVVSRVSTLQNAVGNAYGLEGYNRSNTHGCANMMQQKFVEKIAPDRLCVEVTTYEGLKQNENYAVEWKLLAAYFTVFGEFPPMNGLKPDKRSVVVDEVTRSDRT